MRSIADQNVDSKGLDNTWFKVAVSAVNSAGTKTDRCWRLGSVSGDTRKTLHKELKEFWKNHDKSL